MIDGLRLVAAILVVEQGIHDVDIDAFTAPTAPSAANDPLEAT